MPPECNKVNEVFDTFGYIYFNVASCIVLKVLLNIYSFMHGGVGFHYFTTADARMLTWLAPDSFSHQMNLNAAHQSVII